MAPSPLKHQVIRIPVNSWYVCERCWGRATDSLTWRCVQRPSSAVGGPERSWPSRRPKPTPPPTPRSRPMEQQVIPLPSPLIMFDTPRMAPFAAAFPGAATSTSIDSARFLSATPSVPRPGTPSVPRPRDCRPPQEIHAPGRRRLRVRPGPKPGGRTKRLTPRHAAAPACATPQAPAFDSGTRPGVKAWQHALGYSTPQGSQASDGPVQSCAHNQHGTSRCVPCTDCLTGRCGQGGAPAGRRPRKRGGRKAPTWRPPGLCTGPSPRDRRNRRPPVMRIPLNTLLSVSR